MSVIAFRKDAPVPEPQKSETEKTSDKVAPQSQAAENFEFGLRKPILLGTGIFSVFIVGLGIWAAFAPLSGAVLASGVVKVQDSRKVVKTRDGGIVAQVLVRDGQHVNQGDIVVRMDDVQARSAFEVYDNQLMSLLARRARFLSESQNAEKIEFPKQLMDRQNEASVAQLLADQETLFNTRQQALVTQVGILQQRIVQLDTRITGYQAQISSITRQQALIEEEKTGVASLLKKGLAPKTQLLALERASVDLSGQTGSLNAQIAEARETQGEAQMQISRLHQDRLNEANEGLSSIQTEMANVVPRLQSAKATLELAEVKAPATGTVLGLTQFTNGGVVTPGERILDIVPDGTKLIIQAMVNPQDIAKIHPNMTAMVKLTAYNQRITPSVEGKVMRMSADRLTAENGAAYFSADIEVDHEALARVAQDVQLYPGMPAEVIVPTGERTALDYILAPINDSMDKAFREE